MNNSKPFFLGRQFPASVLISIIHNVQHAAKDVDAVADVQVSQGDVVVFIAAGAQKLLSLLDIILQNKKKMFDQYKYWL